MKRISMLGVASVATIIIVFALMAGCRFKEPAIAQSEPFFNDTKMLMGSHRNKHLECLGEIYGFARLLVKMERTEHPVFKNPDAYYLACMRAKGMVF